jgi:hypothetical protein
MELDHLCRNRACVNPSHCEPVPQYTNLIRSDGLGARNAKKTHCPKGHEYTERSWYHQPGTPRPRRNCLECRTEVRRRKDNAFPRGAAPRCRLRGHVMDEANAGTKSNGRRYCKRCRAMAGAAYYLKHKAARSRP